MEVLPTTAAQPMLFRFAAFQVDICNAVVDMAAELQADLMTGQVKPSTLEGIPPAEGQRDVLRQGGALCAHITMICWHAACLSAGTFKLCKSSNMIHFIL